MANSGATGFTRLTNAVRNSWRGVVDCYVYEEAFRQEIWSAAVLIPLGLWLGEDGVERALLVGAVLLVLVVELLNSGIEAVTDLVSEEHHELAGRAKDMGSAAVSASLLIWLTVWVLVLAGG